MFGNDVDLFVLLLAHNENINCSELFMKTLTGYTSIASIHQFLGNYAASALLPFHALTGCNITGMFSGKRKEFWTKKFLSERNNINFIQNLLNLLKAMRSLQNYPSSSLGRIVQRKPQKE